MDRPLLGRLIVLRNVLLVVGGGLPLLDGRLLQHHAGLRHVIVRDRQLDGLLVAVRRRGHSLNFLVGGRQAIKNDGSGAISYRLPRTTGDVGDLRAAEEIDDPTEDPEKKARLGATVPSGDGGGVLVHLPLERPLTAAGENDRPNDPLRCQGLSPARPFHKGLCVTNDTFFGCLCYSHDRHDHGWIDKIKLFG